MSKTKIINIDDLAQASKAIKLDGETHDMREMTVQEFIDKAAEARSVEAKSAEMTLDEQIKTAVDMVADAFPTVAKARLQQLKLPQLMAIMDLIVTPPEQVEAELKAAEGNA
jgi:hypothetical protein